MAAMRVVDPRADADLHAHRAQQVGHGGDVGQMGRRVARGAEPSGAQRLVRHGGHRALAVGARDVQGGEAPLRMAERLAEARDVLEPQLDAEGFERRKPVEQ